MARVLVLTVIGEDRPGLVEALAQLISEHEGSWHESRMAKLAGHFAGVVQVHLPERHADGLIAALPGLAERVCTRASSTAIRRSRMSTVVKPFGSS